MGYAGQIERRERLGAASKLGLTRWSLLDYLVIMCPFAALFKGTCDLMLSFIIYLEHEGSATNRCYKNVGGVDLSWFMHVRLYIYIYIYCDVMLYI